MANLMIKLTALYLLAAEPVLAGDDTPIALYAVIGGVGLAVLVAAVVLGVVTKKKKK